MIVLLQRRQAYSFANDHTAVDQTNAFRCIGIGRVFNEFSKMLMNLLSLFRSGHFTSTNSPNRFVSDDNTFVLIGRNLIQQRKSMVACCEKGIVYLLWYALNCLSTTSFVFPDCRSWNVSPIHAMILISVLSSTCSIFFANNYEEFHAI